MKRYFKELGVMIAVIMALVFTASAPKAQAESLLRADIGPFEVLLSMRMMSGLLIPIMTEDEMRAIREIIEGDRRARWLWETARTWALWVTAVIAGFTVGVDALKALLKRLTS